MRDIEALNRKYGFHHLKIKNQKFSTKLIAAVIY